MTTQRGERTRKETDRKIMQATLAIALTKGVGGISIEEIARRSGVAKTTIYRRYNNADDLLRKISALEISSSPELAGLEPTRENLTLMLRRMVERYVSSVGVKAIGIILTSDDEFFQRLVQQAIRPEEETFATFFRRGIERGRFRDDLNAKFLFGTMLGSMIACEALRGSVDEDWPERMTAMVWPSIAADTKA
ncbi:TetR family transcriptional regulator [Bifidobacterium primatium]|uniref:TetR family transcriptional regulator n=1 Tax=Bifidobacterium primatium TaxID=2045438 RepID=A0A2M9HBC0_9BIFI|nr:TetR/AcrR family transcriptional regulator [Bifidobacterium primatium]PJM74113.1 TetR family transcriptional regulator [Bifidobacterium primatium]